MTTTPPDEGEWLRVGDVVRTLGRTERAVRRYVAAGMLEARRVGPQLQIRRASASAFARDHGIDVAPDAPRVQAAPAEAPPLPLRPERASRPDGEPRTRSFVELGAWKELAPLVVRALDLLDDKTAGPRADLASRARAHLCGAAEALAAGFGGFHTDAKVASYAEARRLVLSGAADVAVLSAAEGPERDALAGLSADLESKAVRALTGLVRTMEQRGRRRRGVEVSEDGHKTGVA